MAIKKAISIVIMDFPGIAIQNNNKTSCTQNKSAQEQGFINTKRSKFQTNRCFSWSKAVSRAYRDAPLIVKFEILRFIFNWVVISTIAARITIGGVRSICVQHEASVHFKKRTVHFNCSTSNALKLSNSNCGSNLCFTKLENMHTSITSLTEQTHKLPIATTEGTYFINTADIIRFEASSNYTYIYFTNRKPMLVAKLLGDYESLLEAIGFVRTHRSHLVNQRHILFIDGAGNLIMQDDSVAEISRRKKKEVLQTLRNHCLQNILAA
jgi:hypothetical protein